MAREWGDVIQDQFDASNALVHGAPSPDEAIAALHRLSAGYKERLDLAVDAAARYFDDAEKWREQYIAMRRERNEAMGQWVEYLTGQLQFETHLEAEHDDVRRACAVDQRRQMANRMREVVEMWDLKNDIEATDLGLDE